MKAMKVVVVVAVFLSACAEPAPEQTSETASAVIRPDVQCLTTGCSPHTVCTTGDPLPDGCNSCATEVCNQDPFCCSTTWDQMCVDETPTICHCRC
jgi:hypothetical protein